MQQLKETQSESKAEEFFIKPEQAVPVSVVKPEFTSQMKQEDLDKMRMQPKKRQPAQRNTKSVVTVKRGGAR